MPLGDGIITGFNEAAGIHRRKPMSRTEPDQWRVRFNEAAGIHRRKRRALWSVYGASMMLQ